MQLVEIETRLEAYSRACRDGTDWMLGHFNPDGSVGPVEERIFYYRVPWALALMGEVSAAHRLLGWIDDNMLTPNGRLEGISRRAPRILATGRIPSPA